jgi:hypothetical protein
MLIQGQVGPVASSTSLSAGVQATVRMDNLGGLNASQLLPRYYETTYRRQTYSVATQAAVSTSVGMSVSHVGLCLFNPATSSVNLVITKFGHAMIGAPAAAMVVGLMNGVGVTTQTTSITTSIRNRFIGGVGSQCIALTASTLTGTPIVDCIVGTHVITTLATHSNTLVDLEGSIIVPPGGYVATYTSTASGANFFASFQWTEVPL